MKPYICPKCGSNPKEGERCCKYLFEGGWTVSEVVVDLEQFGRDYAAFAKNCDETGTVWD